MENAWADTNTYGGVCLHHRLPSDRQAKLISGQQQQRCKALPLSLPPPNSDLVSDSQEHRKWRINRHRGLALQVKKDRLSKG